MITSPHQPFRHEDMHIEDSFENNLKYYCDCDLDEKDKTSQLLNLAKRPIYPL